MNTAHSVVIPLSKTKLWFSALGCTLFIAFGFFFIFRPWSLISPLIHVIWMIRGIGFISLIVFGYFLGVYIPKIRNRNPGLQIDDRGIVDYSTEMEIGLIDWEDIIEIKKKSLSLNKFMVVRVKNPEKYIERAEGKMRKRTLKANLELCGSPITIPATTLKCKFKELEKILTQSFDHYKKPLVE